MQNPKSMLNASQQPAHRTDKVPAANYVLIFVLAAHSRHYPMCVTIWQLHEKGNTKSESSHQKHLEWWKLRWSCARSSTRSRRRAGWWRGCARIDRNYSFISALCLHGAQVLRWNAVRFEIYWVNHVNVQSTYLYSPVLLGVASVHVDAVLL